MKIPATLKREGIWIVSLTLIMLALAYIPVIRNYQRTPADRYYYGGEEYPLDMVGNIAYVQQGLNGTPLAFFNYSTIFSDKGSILKYEYILIGKFARITNLEPIAAFYVSRFVISLLYLAAIYAIIRTVWKNIIIRIAAYALVLYSTGIILPGLNTGLSGKAVFDALVFERLTTAMPHYLLGGLTAILSLFLLSRTLEGTARIRTFVLSLVLGVVSSLLYGPGMVLLLSGFPLYVIFSVLRRIWQKQKPYIDIRQLIILGIYTGTIALPVVYVRHVVGTVWSGINTDRMESLNPFLLTGLEYVLALGVPYILSAIAIPSVVRRGKPFLMMLATWVIMHPVGEFLLSGPLHLNAIRYFLTPYFIAFGILGAEGIYRMGRVIAGKFTRIPLSLVVIILTAGVLLTGTAEYMANWKRANLCFCQPLFFDFAYPKSDLTDAIFWLGKNTDRDDIVFTGFYSGTLIPAFTGNRVYVSWYYNLVSPPSYGWVAMMISRFYSMNMGVAEARDFIRDTKASYVLYSETERLAAGGPGALTYPFLKEIYTKNGTAVYAVPKVDPGTP